MRSLSATEVLQVWERGQGVAPVERALDLLAAASPGTPAQEFARLPLGQRDSLLLALRQATFGPRLSIYAECPRCGDRLEFEADTREILSGSGLELSPLALEEKSSGGLELEGLSLRFRLPDSRDLAAVEKSPSPAAARRILIERCVIEARRGEETLPPAELPADALARLGEALAQADPLADVTFDLTCPSCAQRWLLAFDIAMFFWSELQSLAKRLLREVHLLARAYGWREGDILALSAARRQTYLEFVQSGGPL
jgi:hypothetical protein